MAAQHGRELGVGDVLEGDIEVLADLGLGGHHLDDILGEGGRIGVVEADPLDAVDAAQPPQQFGQHAFAVEVETVVGGVLRDDDQFAHAPLSQFAGLLLELLHRHRDVRSADERNGAVAALPVAPLGDLQIGIMLRGSQVAFGGQCRILRGAQRAHDAVPRAGSEVFVDLGDLVPQLVGVALRQAADDEQLFDASGLFGLCGAQDHLDGFLLGVADESAGVDDDHFGIRAVAVEEDFVAGGRQPGHEVFAVDGVLRAAERDDVNFFHVRTMR